jgi:hypothetical protein
MNKSVVVNPQLPQLIFPEKVWKRLMAYADIAPGEISGLGKVERHDNGVDLVVTDIFLFEQNSGTASTDLNADAINQFIYSLIEAGENPGLLKLWFHSHGNIDVFWSPTDDATIQGFSGTDYMVSIVVNKYSERKARLDVYKPVRLSLELPVVFRNDFLGVDREKLRKEVKRKVKKHLTKTFFVDLPTNESYIPGGVS